jgi:AcrR family transcriptional regulator
VATTAAEQPQQPGSARRAELLDAAYAYALEHGLAGMSLRPLAAAAGTSPRVLLYLFGSKDELIKEILARSRREQLDLVATVLAHTRGSASSYQHLLTRLWAYLSHPRQRGTIRLFQEAYATSLRPDPGPWAGFARASVTDWVGILTAAQPQLPRAEAETIATATLALLRGLLLDLLARDDPRLLHRALTRTTFSPVTGHPSG